MQTTGHELQSSKKKIDDLKIKHKSALRNLRAHHAKAMASKSEELKDAQELIKGMDELFAELSTEVHAAEAEKRVAEAKVIGLKDRVARAHRNYVEHKLLSAELKDEVREGELNTLELQIQVNEFSKMIDYLYDKLDESRADFDAVVRYIDTYYTEQLDALKPKMIAKHYVANRSGKGIVYLFIMNFRPFANTHCFWTLYQASMLSGCRMWTN